MARLVLGAIRSLMVVSLSFVLFLSFVSFADVVCVVAGVESCDSESSLAVAAVGVSVGVSGSLSSAWAPGVASSSVASCSVLLGVAVDSDGTSLRLDGCGTCVLLVLIAISSGAFGGSVLVVRLEKRDVTLRPLPTLVPVVSSSGILEALKSL